MTIDREAVEARIAELRAASSHVPQGILASTAEMLSGLLAETDSVRDDVEHFASQCRTANADIRALQDEVARLTKERLFAVCEVDQLRKQVSALTEAMGTERYCGQLQRRLRVAHEERDAARAAVAKLTAAATNIERQRYETAVREIEALVVVEAAEMWRDVEVDDTVESNTLMRAVDAWRARKVGGG